MTLREFRCPKCGKLLVRSDAQSGRIEAFCRPCGARRLFELDAPVPLRVLRA